MRIARKIGMRGEAHDFTRYKSAANPWNGAFDNCFRRFGCALGQPAMRLLEFIIVDALPERRAFRTEASRHFVQARIDDAIPLATGRCEERHEYFRHELFELQRCVERLLRTLMI